MLGSGYQELSGGVERVRGPSCGEHSLTEDEVDVFAFADTKANAYIHLRADRTLSHGFLGWALSGRNEGDGHGTATASDGIGKARSVRCVVGEFRVFINDDYQGRHFW